MRSATFLIFIIVVAFSLAQAAGISFNDPLVDAADSGDKEKVIRLLRQGHSPDSKGDFGVTPLMRASFRGYRDIVKILVESGAYINASDIGGDTPLHLAAKNGHAAIVEDLINYDAYIDIPDKEKWTPLMRAVMAKQNDVASILINKGADIALTNNMDESVLVHAATIGSPQIMEMIMASGKFDLLPSSQRFTAMQIAEKKGNEKVGRMLSSMEDSMKKQYASSSPSRQVDKSPYEINLGQFDDSLASGDYDTTEEYSSMRDNIYDPPRVRERAASAPPPDYMERYQEPKNEPALAQVAPVIEDETKPFDLLAEPTPKIATPKQEKIAQIKEQLGGYKQAFPEEFGGAKTPLPASKPVSTEVKPGEDFYTIQLGAFSSEEQAAFVWNNLQNKNPELLGDMDADILVENDEENFRKLYKLRSGRFKWDDIAVANCDSLKSRNIDCLVMKGKPWEYRFAKTIPSQKTQFASAQESSEVPTVTNMVGGVPIPVSREYASANTPSEPAPAKQQTTPSQQASSNNDLPWLAQPGYQSPNYNFPPTQPPAYAQNNQYRQPPMAPPPSQQFAQNRPQQYIPPPGNAPIDIAPNPPAANNWQAPVNNRQQQFAPAQNNQAGLQASLDQQVREVARQNFFQQQGLPKPTPKHNYDEFYRDVQRQAGRSSNLSEAVLVPNNSVRYSNTNSSPAAGAWLHIESFPNQNSANDYGTRMFRYDESLGNLNIILANGQRPGAVAMRVGPMAQNQAYNLCASVNAGGLSCNIKGSGNPTSYNQQFANRSPVNKFWVNLGTFADTPEAEYYWAFLREDNGDLLTSLEYDMADAGKHGAFGDDAVQLRVGPFNAKNRADQICSIMRYRNVACLVQ